MIQIEQIHGAMSCELQERLAGTWGSAVRVTRGRVHNMADLKGFVASDEMTGRLAGIALYRQDGRDMELVVLDSIFPRRGVGTRLLEAVVNRFQGSNLSRLWLVTTNDNVNSLRFFQKRGFNLCGLYPNALGISGTNSLHIGYDGIPICHELELELKAPLL